MQTNYNPVIVYDSMTGNVARFISKLQNYEVFKISDLKKISKPYILVTYTTGFGEVPKTTLAFLESNKENMIAVASSGNRNWGANFAKSGEIISSMYNVPLLLKFELSGTRSDLVTFMQEVERVAKRIESVDQV